jgi:tRNA modification GTPase
VSQPTYAACLTPPGTGGIAVIAVWGLRALSTVESLFRARSASKCSSNHLLALRAPDGRFFLGRFGGEIADEVVLSVKQTEPVPSVEIHCHGGAEVVRLLLESLQHRGVEVCTWQEWEARSGDEPLRAAAAVALTEARTVRTAAILLDQYHGAFDQAVREIIAALDKEDIEYAGERLDELAHFADLGRHLTRPWRVVVAGPPNVGKSSLVNALAGYQRAVVSATPGTTRDVVTTEIAVDGWPIELADTAGLRDSGEVLELQGIAQARTAADAADLCLWLLDA